MVSFGKLRALDMYRRVPVDLTEPTAPGAIMSVLCAVFMAWLFVSEVLLFMTPQEHYEMVVQQDQGDRLQLNFNITFPKLPCFVFSMDVVDIMGRHEVGISQTITKRRLQKETRAHVADYNDETLSDEDARTQAQEGCNIEGFVLVNKVPGNFHLSAHGKAHYVQRFLGGIANVNHIVHYLWCGRTRMTEDQVPGHKASLSPLDNFERDQDHDLTTYEYFLDIIPTNYKEGVAEEIKTYQMTAHKHHFQTVTSHMPAVYFRYQLSPITVNFASSKRSFAHFLTGVCAIIGGVFTVAGLLSGVIHSIVLFQKKMMGKDQ